MLQAVEQIVFLKENKNCFNQPSTMALSNTDSLSLSHTHKRNDAIKGFHTSLFLIKMFCLI